MLNIFAKHLQNILNFKSECLNLFNAMYMYTVILKE